MTTYTPQLVLFCGHVYGRLGVLDQRVHDLEQRLGQLGANVEQQSRRNEQHVAVLAACQRDTSNALNHAIERHALHPAIEAVAALAAELFHLRDRAGRSLDGDAGGEGANKLQKEIDICCSIAQEKLANLDVQMIAPAEGEELDAKTHSPCGYVATPNEGLHTRISRLVTPGIVYRGKMLRQARVIVFRLGTSRNPQSRKEPT